MKAQPGKRDELAERMLASAETLQHMEGCLFYLLNESVDEPDTVWVMEMWESAEAHAASLKNEQVAALIKSCLPLLADASSVPLRFLGGKGL